MIFGMSVHDGIVDDAAVLIDKDHVTCPVDRALVDVPGCQQLRQIQGVGTNDFHLALRGDVPERDALDDRPVLGGCVAVAGGHEHVVVDGKSLSAGLYGRVIEGGFPDSGPDRNRRRCHGVTRSGARSILWRL